MDENMNNQLKLGFMTNEELAAWSGKSLNTITKNKRRWCENNLKPYAEYETARGGVKILEIINPYFLSSARQEVKQKYLEYYGHYDEEAQEHIYADTAKNCWKKLKPHMTNLSIADSTGVAYAGTSRREDFGSVKGNNKGKPGRKGECHFVFGKVINNEFYHFTEEEENIKKQLFKKYFHDLKIEQAEKQQALTWGLKHKELTVEEYAQAMSELLDNDINWVDFQIALDKALGCHTDFRVELTLYPWADKTEEEKQKDKERAQKQFQEFINQ